MAKKRGKWRRQWKRLATKFRKRHVWLPCLAILCAATAILLLEKPKVSDDRDERLPASTGASIVPTPARIDRVLDVPPLQAALAARLESHLEREVAELPRSCRVSVEVRDPATGQVLFARQPTLPLIPASNTKVFTGAAMLDVLGPDWTFETPFLADGKITNGVLDGDLIVRGSGDLTLSARLIEDDPMNVMQALARRIREAGITEIRGRVVADGRAFVGPRRGEAWPPDPSWRRFMVEVSALVFNENRASLECWTSGDRTYASLVPDVGIARLVNQLRPTSESRSEVINVTRPEDENRFSVTGRKCTRTSRYKVDVNMHDGDLYFAAALATALGAVGVPVRGGSAVIEPGRNTRTAKTLFTYTSKLIDSLPVMLQHSQNLFAEVYFRVFAKASGKDGSFMGGREAMEAWLDRCGILEEGTHLEDGSGLSRNNRTSARQLARVHERIWRRADLRSVYSTSLATPGEDGTLERRVPTLAGALYAKTGTLSGARSLSGFVRNRGGRWLVFAILCNGDIGKARSVMDRFVLSLHDTEIGVVPEHSDLVFSR